MASAAIAAATSRMTISIRTLEINPTDAQTLAIADGQILKAHNARGSVVLYAAVTDGVRPGTVVSPKGHWGRRSLDGRNVNQLTTNDLSDLGGSSSFHGTRGFAAPATAGDLELVGIAVHRETVGQQALSRRLPFIGARRRIRWRDQRVVAIPRNWP